jgi:FlaA1/EpsC-like NDP-sugar epimerase
MSVEEAVELVLNSVIEAKGGEVFVTKMPVMRIEDLAVAMIGELSSGEIKIVEIGSKPGEKLYEELMSDEETRRTVELDKFFSVLPAFRGIYSDIKYDYSEIVSKVIENPYVSEKQIFLTVEEVKDFLHDNNLLSDFNEKIENTRYWPGDKEEKV